MKADSRSKREQRENRSKKFSVSKALHESESKFQDLSEKSLVGIYLIQNGLFRYVNPTFAEIFGFAVDEVIDRKGPGDLPVPEDREMVKENVRRRVSGEIKSLRYEFRGVTKDGRVIDVEAQGSRTEYLGTPALIGTIQDVTERKKAEELLRQAEEKYRGIFENAVEGIFQSTPRGRLIAANPALAKMLGYQTPEEVTAVHDVSRQIYVDRAQRREFVRTLERDGIIRGFECEFYRKDGSRIWVSMNARAIRDGNGVVNCYEGTIEDITERKKSEYELNLLNQLNRSIVDNAPVAIFTLNKDGAVTSVNSALASLAGLDTKTAEKLLGFDWLKNPFAMKSGLAGHIERGLKGEKFQLWDFPFINFVGDKHLYIDFKGVPLKGRDGSVDGLLCIVEDTTHRVETRARALQEAKMSFIGRLAAGIAHQLNNPLAMVVAYAELAAKQVTSFPHGTDKNTGWRELSEYLNIVEEEAFRCRIVVDDLLRLPQKDGFEVTDVDINELLSNLLELVGVGKSGVKITKELSPSLPLVRGDVTGLRQIFMNLISNALDAVEGRADGSIMLRTKPARGHVTVEVKDNGVGIPTTIVDNIFEPFFTTKESKGLGLGLSLCHDLLSNMGGAVRADSKPGRGTSFFVTLPASKAG
jgi:PAS domain S-box-containing protein